jgi:hypothetical protein
MKRRAAARNHKRRQIIIAKLNIDEAVHAKKIMIMRSHSLLIIHSGRLAMPGGDKLVSAGAAIARVYFAPSGGGRTDENGGGGSIWRREEVKESLPFASRGRVIRD